MFSKTQRDIYFQKLKEIFIFKNSKRYLFSKTQRDICFQKIKLTFAFEKIRKQLYFKKIDATMLFQN